MTFLTAKANFAADNNWGRNTQFAACLTPMLEALGWRGDPEQVIEAMPHFKTTMDELDFRSALANLHYGSTSKETTIGSIDPRLYPCLFNPERGSLKILLSKTDEGYYVYDAGKQDYRTLRNPYVKKAKGTAYFFNPIPKEKIGQWNSSKNWFRAVFGRFAPLTRQILMITFILNILALATPLFIMAVYDMVIGANSKETLKFLVLGIVIAFICEIVLRLMRGRMLSYISARLDYIIGSTVLQKILSLPVSQTERSSLGSKLARFREFDMIREFFIGPMAMALLEIPFVFIFLIAVGLIGGPLVIIPILMIVLYIIAALVILPIIQKRTTDDLTHSASKGSFVTECFNNMRTIKQLGAEEIWLERYRDISTGNAIAGIRNNMIAAIAQTFAHVVMITAGILTLTFGISRVFEESMTVGALVATMALIWRMLSPTQTVFLALTKLNQIGISIKRLNQLFTLQSESNPYASSKLKEFKGQITFSRVSFRYSPEQDPAVMGLDLQIMPGEVVAFAGANSSGKSTVIKLLAGLYQPQVGRISLDGVDIRQIDPLELRKSMGYMPQNSELFHGTIRQNLLLAKSTASEEQILEACEWANLTEDINNLPDKLDTRIGDQTLLQLPAGFQQRMIMARALLCNAKIMIFDEPGNTLDEDGDLAFLEAVEKIRGKATVIIITHRPSHMRAADRVVLMNRGMVQTIGPASSVIPLLFGGA
ncbi:peptidase domain-containing ABC transporter [Sneathiella glossodoripedis]|uniref:peptidase domain-containing ABC transporter n=1 Tax=Sneathiella glossodoripedis TaxID=418853 RepID=UPI000472C2F0|nr:peptidase domain-containing ABC transporter [Sneathiella glossodoripedis]